MSFIFVFKNFEETKMQHALSGSMKILYGLCSVCYLPLKAVYNVLP